MTSIPKAVRFLTTAAPRSENRTSFLREQDARGKLTGTKIREFAPQEVTLRQQNFTVCTPVVLLLSPTSELCRTILRETISGVSHNAISRPPHVSALSGRR